MLLQNLMTKQPKKRGKRKRRKKKDRHHEQKEDVMNPQKLEIHSQLVQIYKHCHDLL